MGAASCVSRLNVMTRRQRPAARREPRWPSSPSPTPPPPTAAPRAPAPAPPPPRPRVLIPAGRLAAVWCGDDGAAPGGARAGPRLRRRAGQSADLDRARALPEPRGEGRRRRGRLGAALPFERSRAGRAWWRGVACFGCRHTWMPGFCRFPCSWAPLLLPPSPRRSCSLTLRPSAGPPAPPAPGDRRHRRI
jgi:hypothetical protein